MIRYDGDGRRVVVDLVEIDRCCSATVWTIAYVARSRTDRHPSSKRI